MLSKKMAFSLTSLITILALAFVASPSVAQFEVSLSVDDSDDVSYADGIQVLRGASGTAPVTTIRVKSDKVVNHVEGPADVTTAAAASGKSIGADDFTITAYNKFGGTISIYTGTGINGISSFAAASSPDGKNFMMNFTLPDANSGAATGDADRVVRVHIALKKDLVELADPLAELNDDGSRKAAGKNKAASIEIHYVMAEPTGDSTAGTGEVPHSRPRVNKIERGGNDVRPVTAATFDVVITLSEMPRKDGFKKDHIDVSNATASDPVAIGPIAGMAPAGGSDFPADGYSGGDMMQHRYVVTITPKYENKNDIVVKVKAFWDQVKPGMGDDNMYMPPTLDFTEGMDMLTVKVGKEDLKAKAAGIKVGLPKEKYIPGSGYLVVLEDLAGSSVHKSDTDIKDPPKAHQRTPAELKYNTLVQDIPNLETHLANGGTIGVMSPHALVITEIMWGSDAGLADPGDSQWIELYNAGAGYQTQDGDNTTYLIFYGPGEAPTTGLKDLVGTVDDTAGYWSIAGKGQSGRTEEKAAGAADARAITSPIISMNRVMDAAGEPAPGTLATSWVASIPPSSNFEVNRLGVHVGSPGAMPVTYPTPPAPTPEPTPAPVIPAAMGDDIMITEIMVNTSNGRLPQWIELTSMATGEVSLEGWEMVIDNAIDADVLGGGNAITVSLSGVTLKVSEHEGNTGRGQSALVVAWSALRKSDNIRAERIINVGAQLGQTRRFQLLSYNGFRITLVPPQTGAIADFGDIAGNLHEDWELPMDGRSSLIRHEMDAAGMAMMGTDLNGWKLASATDLSIGQESYYGDDEDNSTPGHDSGGPLPVELSHFRPARDKQTGAVVITWATESELNNAGFFIKRSNQRDGEFQVINATMVPGAGTTSEKQTYTYTDTTAQPNIVYYYQIEDVSLDGNRQTLTRGIRLKGHIGAAGKLTSTWGELKSSNE